MIRTRPQHEQVETTWRVAPSNAHAVRLCQVALVAAMLATGAARPAPAALADDRERYLEAEKALKAGQLDTFAKLRASLETYPLKPYLDYAQAKGDLSRLPAARVSDAIENLRDTPLAARLRTHYLHVLGNRRDWDRFVEFYMPQRSTALRCYFAEARLTGKTRRAALDEGRELWLHGKSRPKACDPLFAQLAKAGVLDTETVWARFALAMHAGSVSLGRYLMKQLPRADRALATRWVALRSQPGKVAALAPSEDRAGQPLTRYALRRLARKNAESAAELWQEMSARHQYPAATTAAVRRRIGISLATGHASGALAWLENLADEAADEVTRAWRVRSAIRGSDWRAVLSAYARLKPAEKREVRWRYWQARAFDALGQRTRAEKIFARLADDRSFYGFLAADRMGLAYKLNHVPLAPPEPIAKRLRADPAIARASELLALGRIVSARREWFALLDTLDQQGKAAAAQIAHAWDWPDGAILTLGRARLYGDVVVRFPLQYREQVTRNARRWNVPASWVFAVMRQESAFMAKARSPVGATGLMQIMPATGRQIARRLRVRYRGQRDLLDPARNIMFGSSYLAQLQEELNGHPALATAGYNAGPHRSKRWQPPQPIAADQWIETIPFSETRKYTRRVFAYEIIYRERMGLPVVRLSERLKPIPARS
ncbi:MAG: transglycosylase SLT domain-containing protein [Pseudomonadota bacterium]